MLSELKKLNTFKNKHKNFKLRFNLSDPINQDKYE